MSVRASERVKEPTRRGRLQCMVPLQCIQSMSNNVIIIGSDTDLRVYGMAFKQSGWLQNKQVYVERTLNTEFVDICEIYNVVQTYPILSKIPYPLNSLVAL